MDVRKGLLLVSAGIQEQNYDAAKDEILAQLEAVKKGGFSAEDLETAKSGVASDLHSVPDSQSSLESFYLSQAVAGTDCGPLEMAELVSEVDCERVSSVAASTVCDQIFVLKGSPAEEEFSAAEEETEVHDEET